MRTCLYFAILLALLVAGSAFAAQVTTVDLKYVNGGAIAHIGVQGTFQFTHKTEPPKDGRPDRLIIDVLDATHNWGPKGWSSLPACGVQNVRIGQYSSKPDKVVRVVFDLVKAPVYRVDTNDKGVDIYFTDNSLKPFSTWTTGPAPSTPPALPPAVVATPPATQTEKPVTVVVVAPTTPKTDVKPVEKAPVVSHTMLAANAPAATPTTAPTSIATAASPEPKAKAGVATVTMSKPVVLQPQPNPASATAKTTATPTAPAPAPTVKPAVVPKAEVAPAPAPATPKPSPQAPQPEVKTPSVATAATTEVESTPPTKTPAPTAATVETPAPQSGSPVVAEAGTPTDGSASGSVRPTARFRRSANARIKSSLVAEFPQRLVIKYESMGNRDPFATLIDDSRTYNTPLEQRVPNIDGLKLVGIIESPGGDNRALFEDKNAFSYILQSGDKIQRGYVLRVEDDRVYFQIFEYGWSRTIALTLENRE